VTKSPQIGETATVHRAESPQQQPRGEAGRGRGADQRRAEEHVDDQEEVAEPAAEGSRYGWRGYRGTTEISAPAAFAYGTASS
jgi:hypothetical protein